VGKGKLARVLSIIATGGLPAIVTEGHCDEETEKRISTAVIQGSPAILLDNLQRHLASSTLESMLTEEIADVRTFGKLSSIKTACRALVLLTANNASMRRDMLRRGFPVRLVVPDESPELRRFDFDPVEEAERDRHELLTAAFTIALAWLAVRDLDENKAHSKALGSFEKWADIVGGAVSWLTGTSPVDLIEEQKDQDQNSGDERAVILALAAKFGTDEWTAATAAKELEADTWATVLRFKGDKPTSRDVAYWLRSRKDRVFGSFTLTSRAERDRTHFYRLVPPKRACADDADDNFTSRAKSGSGDGGDGAKSRREHPSIVGNHLHHLQDKFPAHGNNPPTCRVCGEAIDTSRTDWVPLADGSFEHDACAMAAVFQRAGAR
jgi:hypothetical protein